MFHDLYFVSSDVEINFSLGQKQTVLYVLLAGTIVCIIKYGVVIRESGLSKLDNGICVWQVRATMKTSTSSYIFFLFRAVIT